MKAEAILHKLQSNITGIDLRDAKCAAAFNLRRSNSRSPLGVTTLKVETGRVGVVYGERAVS